VVELAVWGRKASVRFIHTSYRTMVQRTSTFGFGPKDIRSNRISPVHSPTYGKARYKCVKVLLSRDAINF
jgi:hypothetical protein